MFFFLSLFGDGKAPKAVFRKNMEQCVRLLQVTGSAAKKIKALSFELSIKPFVRLYRID